MFQASAPGKSAAEYYESLNVQPPEAADAAIHFSRQRTLAMARDDIIRPVSELEAEAYQNFYALLDSVDTDSIAPIKQEWIFNVCGMAHIDSFTAIPKVRVCCCLPPRARGSWCVLTGPFSSVQYLADEMVDEMLSEINGLYYESVRQAIADYVLLNEDERKRLQVSATPRESAVRRGLEFDFGDT